MVAVTEDGQAPTRYTGTTYADLTDAGAEPTGTVGLSAFGRLWITDSADNVIKYCALLDETDWSGADTGGIDMRNVWPEGDVITALAAFNGSLVVFGRTNIAVYSDGQGHALGIDPTQIALVDTISGVGCTAKDTIQLVQGDLWFLSDKGLQSLSRLIQEKSNPLNNLSKNIEGYIQELVAISSASAINAIYSPDDRFYLLSLPRESGGAEAGRTLVFDTRGRLEDGSVRCTGDWSLVSRGAVIRADQTFLFANYDAVGEVGLYDGYSDDGASYSFNYESGWLDLTKQGYLIFPKRLTGLFYVEAATTLQLKWAFDFTGAFTSRTKTVAAFSAGAEYSVAEWSEDEFGGASGLREGRVAGSGSGQYVKLGVQSNITGQLATQQLNLFAKIGRLN